MFVSEEQPNGPEPKIEGWNHWVQKKQGYSRPWGIVEQSQ